MSKLLSAAVTVCAVPSSFVTFTVVPAFTTSGSGENWKFAMVIEFGVFAPVAAPAAEPVSSEVTFRVTTTVTSATSGTTTASAMVGNRPRRAEAMAQEAASCSWARS